MGSVRVRESTQKLFFDFKYRGKRCREQTALDDTPLFSEFSQTWLDEMRIQWRRSYIATIEGTLENYLIPEFGESEFGHITRQEILSFRASLAKVETRCKKPLSASRVNRIMTPFVVVQ